MSTILDRLFRKNADQPTVTANNVTNPDPGLNMETSGSFQTQGPWVTPGFADAFPGAVPGDPPPADPVQDASSHTWKALIMERKFNGYLTRRVKDLRLQVTQLTRACARHKRRYESLRYATETEYADARRSSFEAGVNHATDVLLRKGIVKTNHKLVQPSDDRVRAFLREAYKQGKRLQVWHTDRGATVDEGQWEDLTMPLTLDGVPVLGCPVHLYRVHPDDAVGFEANLPR